MAFYYATIGTTPSSAVQNIHYELENCTLTNVGVAMSGSSAQLPSLNFHCGLTPPGDEHLRIYLTLLSGFISQSDGLSWSGSIRIRSNAFIVLNFYSLLIDFIYLTWTTTG